MTLLLLTKDELYNLAIRQRVTMDIAANTLKAMAKAITHDGQRIILEHTIEMLEESK